MYINARTLSIIAILAVAVTTKTGYCVYFPLLLHVFFGGILCERLPIDDKITLEIIILKIAQPRI